MSYKKTYNPLQAGTLTGDIENVTPHDNAIARAQYTKFRPPSKHVITTNPLKTLFVGRLNYDTTEDTLMEFFKTYGKISKVVIIHNFVTGLSEGYGFITFERTYACEDAYKNANGNIIDNHRILVDYEFGRTMKGWIPRRLGGGYGGIKISGQLRFGGREKPFRSESTYSKNNSTSHSSLLSYKNNRSDSSSRYNEKYDKERSSKHSSDRSSSSRHYHRHDNNDKDHRKHKLSSHKYHSHH